MKKPGIIAIRSVLASAALLFFQGILAGQENPATETEQLWKELSGKPVDSARVAILSRLSFLYLDNYNDWRRADSTAEMAIAAAGSSFRPSLRLAAYNNYLETNDLRRVSDKARDIARKALGLCALVHDPQAEWRTYKNFTAVELAAYNYDEALKWSYKALSVAGLADNDAMKAESYLYIGQSLQGKNQSIEAFRNYLNAAGIAEKSGDPALLKKCYNRLSAFYNLIKMYEKATFYKLKEGTLILASEPVDSTALMWIRYDLQAIDVNSNNNALDDNSARSILGYAVRKGLERLKYYEFALYRTHLINADQVGSLKDLYTRIYPEEFNRLESENSSLWYRLKAYFAEYEKKPDSATAYFKLAEERIGQDPNRISRSNFFKRYGQFLVRQGRQKEALVKFKAAYDLAREVGYTEYILSASDELESLNAALGNFKEAYRYLAVNQSVADSMEQLSRREDLLALEINHETRLRELAAEKEAKETLRRHNIQYTAITVGIAAVFLMLMLLGSFKVPEWSIRSLGFFSFIFLFEFITLIADHAISSITHDEPWKVLGIKIVLIGFLLPFHEWLEETVTGYLIRHRLIDFTRFPVYRRIRKTAGSKKPPPEPSA